MMSLILKFTFKTYAYNFIAVIAMCLGLMAGAVAQEPKVKQGQEVKQAQEVKQEPTIPKTQEAFGSWILECALLVQKKSAKTTGPFPRPDSFPEFVLPRKKSCQITQTFKNKKTGSEFARLALANDPNTKGRMLIGLRTVVDASFDVPVRINMM